MKTIQLSNLAGKVFATELNTKRFEIFKILLGITSAIEEVDFWKLRFNK
jgi:hypothetical protein